VNYCSQAVSTMERIYRRVGFTNSFENMRDKVIHRKFSAEVLLHKLRNLASALVAAKGGTSPHSSRDELKRSSTDFMSGGGYANDATRTPSAMRAFESSAHNAGVASAVERVVDTPLCKVAGNMLLDGFIQFAAVDAVRGSEFDCILKFRRIHIYSNDTTCSGNLCSLNRSKTDSS
jgi:hypothetical protein